MIYWLTTAVFSAIALTIYLFIGWRIATIQLPVTWAKARYWDAGGDLHVAVRWRTAAIVLFWLPFLIGRVIRALAGRVLGRVDQVLDAGDPVALAAKVAERDRHIAQLERDLGIKDRP
jgi:hypothetical protein